MPKIWGRSVLVAWMADELVNKRVNENGPSLYFTHQRGDVVVSHAPSVAVLRAMRPGWMRPQRATSSGTTTDSSRSRKEKSG